MKGHTFVARARKYAHGEIKRGTYFSMLKQLGIRKEDF
jgi:hypothetical protein